MASFTSKTSSIKRKDAFSEELSAVLGKRGKVTTTEEMTTTYCEVTSQESGELIFTANQDFIADDMDALTLHRGEQVILLDTGCDPSKHLKLDPDLDLGTDVGSLLDNTAARHKISVRPRRKHADSRQRATLRDERWLVQCCDDVMRQGWVPSYILTSQKSFAEADSPTEAKYQREAVIRELVETEEEFGRDIQQVVDEYLKPLDSSSVPRIVRDNKDLIFNNLKQIADFHNTVLIEGLKYYANEPRMLGKTFLRLERDFDKHVTYCRDEPAAQDFLMENEEARDFFEELSQQLGDDKSLCEHLKLPIQRINDYQLLLKELVKYSKQLGEDTADLGKALELMLAVPHRANDNKFISNIEGYHGNIHKLGRLLRHDWFCVTDRDGKSKERYLFLFKARILICKVRRISEDRFVFVLKDIIRLPEVEVKDHIDDSKVFELHHKQPGYGGYPLTISGHKNKIKDFWLAEIRQYASDVLALAEHAADDLRLQELNEDNRNLELPAGIHIEPATPEQSIPLEPRGDSTAVKTDIFAEFQKKRDARTAKTAEDTKKVSKTSEEKVLTDSEQPLKPDSEQSQQTGNTSSKPSESTPGSEAKKLEQVVESPKPVSEPSKPVSEPPKTISEPLKPVSEPPKAVSEPPKPISEPSKSISEPPKPVTEPSKPVSEPIKPVSESPKPVTEPPKPVNEPSKPISEPPKPASEPTKPASELSKPVSEPPTPVSESLQPTEIKKLVTDLTEPTVKSTETVAELPKLETESSKPTSEIQKRKSEALKPETEGQKPVSEQPKPTSEPSEPVNKLPKLEAEPSKTATELFKSTPEPQETVTEPPKSISEPPKIETDFQKPVAENPVTEPPKPTADIQKQTTTEPPKVTVEQKPTIETQKPVTPTSTVTKEVEQKPISPQPIDVPIVTEKATKDTLILSKQQLKEEQLELESKQEVVGGVKRKESADSASEKKVKFEEDTEMDGYSSYSSRRSGTRHVEVEEYRSVSSSSSQEVYIETSASRQQLSSGMSTSQNMRLVEESTIINGQLVSHSQEITGGGGGYTKIQELTAGTDDVGGYTTIEEYISGSDANDVKGFASEKESTVAITEVQISDVRRRSSGPKFKKTIEGINIEPGERAVFECHLEDKAKVIWLKNNKPLEDKLADRINSLSCNDTAYRLEILGAHESDAGTYTARAVNETGDASSCSALLLVEKLAEEEKKKREESRIPWFLVRLKDTEVLENTYLRFMVKVKGYKPDVKFYKDDRLITVANERVQINKEQADVGFYELIIPDVLQEDVGIYKCIASNRYGEVECEATVTVTDDKKIFEGLEESDLLKPGEQPNFTWLRDGQPFDPEERFKVLFKDEEDSLALVFQHVKPEDAGLYTCVATTSTGKISCSAELTVQGAVHHLLREPEKPTVSTEIKKVEANINGSAMIELTVDGYPKPEVKWTKDGKEITAGSKYKILYEDEKSMSLLIKNVTIEDAGSYKVEAKNDLGIDSEEITVTVKAPPKIKKKLTDYSGMAGETIKMTVEIEGEPKPNVTWYKDGKVIIKSDHVKTYDESSTSYTLLIEKSTLDDAGSYSVVASNELSQTSEFCKVEVLSPPQFISTMTKNVISKEGETIIYQVKVQGEPKPTVKWFCYGNELKSDGTHIKITEDQQTHTLTVSGVTREDAGKYTCEISNVYGKNSDSSTLNVRCSPQFRQKLTDKVAKEGDTNVEFTVNIEAFPKPNVKWFHNETEITQKTTEYTKIEEGDNYKLIIKEVTTAMSGKYSCKVVNELGSNETSATFAVHSKPKFSKGLKDIQVDEGASLTLQIEVEGTPDPVVKWYKDGDEVTGDAHIKITRDTQRVENYSMTFTLVKSSDAGEYEVRASNEMGTAVTKSIVTVQTKTTMIQGDKIKVQEEKPVQREEEKPKPKKAAKAEVEEVSVQEIKPAEVVKTEEIKITQEAAKIEVEQPQKIVETETLTPKKSVEEEIITVQEKAEVQIEPPKKLETVEKKEKSPKRAIKIEKPEEIIKEPPSLPQKISVKSEEKTPEQASIIEKPEEIIEEPPRLPQKISVKSEEKTPEQASIIEKPEEIIQEPPSLPQKISVKSEENVPEQAKKIEKPDEIIEEVPSLPQKASTKQPETPKTAEINAAPEIISADMNDRTIYESLGTKFEIQAKGVPRPEAKWYKDGEELKSSDHIKITEENDKYRLEITKAKMTDAGNYKCKVVNKMGEKAQSAKLSITAETALREPKIKVPLKDQSVPKNEEATMTIILTADPIPEVRWTHDDKDISETYILSSESKEIEDGLKEVTYTLKIPKGCHQDTGVYQFVAKNKFGTAESSARLDIVFKPEITCFKDVVTVPFSNSEMVANILANPRPDIKWSAGGKAVDIDGEHYVTENDTINEVYKLLINGSSINDENTYIVTASNKIGESSAQARFSVHTEPPSILKGIENHSLKDYEPFEFKIRANGIPKPQIIWLKDREEIQPNFRVNIETSDEGQVSSCLSIPHFSEDDVGKYTVKAVSMAGEAESSAKLRMTQIPPSFLKALPRSAEVGEGEPLELKAKLDGSPIPKVKWFKDGAPLVADDHVKIVNSPDGSIKLQIDSVKPTDCGAYKVIAVNPNGESTGICAVAVTPTPRRPSFSKELSDANVTEGEPLRLEAQVMAFPAPEVKWFKDGHPVRPSPGVSFINSPGGLVGLVVDKMRPEDAGTYTLTVANKLGDISSTAKVGVPVKEKKPQFLSQLMPANVVEGFPAKMEIKVSGHPLPQIAWTLNGKPIVPDGEHIKIVDGPDGSQCLVIDKATPEDAGVYAVVAKNSQGEITSQAPLHVATKGRSDIPQEPPSFPKGLRDTTADEETPLTFSAPFLGNPIPDVVWSKDGVPLQASERVQFTCDGNKVGLEINPSKVSDVGIYSCQLKNPLGETESQAKATVRKIYQKPQFTQRFSDLQQLPTFDAKFFARVTGNPKPEISWYKDGNIIKESPKYRMKRDGDTVCLYVQDCTPEDSGIYRCIASNKEGQDTCDAQLQVVDKIEKPQRKEAPAFLKKIGDCEIFKGMTAKFTACATGYPEPEVEWYKGDEKLYPSERIKMEQEGTGLLRLLISGVDPQIDVGKYRCRIFNPYGEDSCEANILCDILDVKPRKPVGDQYTDYDKFRSTGAPLPLADRPIISRMTDRRLTLSWKPSIPIGPRDPVTYHVEMCELPNGDWFTARTGVRSCACDISNLEPFRDYKFRIRVENKYGISDPSPFAQTYREKLLPDPPKFVPYLPPGIDFRPETSPYFPKDFDIERPPHDGYAQAPRFLHQEHDTQYGVKGHNCNLFWFVYGYPKPKMQYFFNDEPIEMGGQYDSSYTRNGQATLFINKMLDRDVGVYEAVATNEHGEARQRVRLEIAEYPEFIKRPNETIIMIRRSGRLEARVTGVPPPEIKWYKDWQPLAQSSRIKMQHIEPDVYILVINDVILKDEGLYSISARNIAGSISSSVMIRVEENEADYSYHTYDKGRSVKPRTNKTLEDLYDLGDELGRGTQGITYHAVERLSGRNYAAKMMHGKGELRAYMRNELEIMNLLNHRKLIRLHDAFETPDSFMLITELAGGGELLDTLTKQTFTTESEIAGYIRQILLGLEHMHDLNIAHLGLTPGDLLISHAGGDDLKICDFGLARRIAYGKLAALDFGMPEYVAPEIINGEGVSFSADMWAVGIITHLLLTGISIFRSVDDRTTLTNIKEDRWEFNEDIWKNLSSEARDFIRQLVVHQPERRMDVKAALKHPWLTFADKIPSDQYQITTDTLRNYCNLYKDWYSNASCRLWYRRRPLIGAFSHPSRMVYPPGHVYTPEPSPEPRRSKDYSPHIRTWEDRIPSREPIDYELGVVKSESHYQNGPDTYLLQLRDVDFPVRLREYMKVAANRAPGYSRQVSDQHHLDWKAPVIRERRRFTDVMDEEIDDERRARINKYGNADLQTMRRLKHEIGTRLDTHVEADALMEAKRDGHAPFFREKPQILPIVEDQNAQLVCYAVGDPNPTVQWFKNDLVVTESHRLKIIEDDTGRSILSFSPAASFDIGIYKVVARNKIGQVIARTRVVLAQPPDAPDSPDASDISDTEVLLRWKQPKEDGNSPVVCYSLQYKEADTVDWKDVASNIDHEFFVIRGLRPNIAYQFRLSARNKIGWSEKGIPTKPIKTKAEGAPKVQVTKAMKHLQSLCEAGQEIVIEEVKHPLDYSIERNRIEWSNEIPTEKYNFISEIARGRYSVVVKGIDKANDQVIVAKVLDYRPDTEAQVNQEFEVLRSLRHERIAALTHTFKPGNTPVAVFILEKLQGADILTYLSSRHEYTEQMVATVVTQVLDALQYLHWRGYCHLNLEPDNIVMASVRSIQIKLVDFGAAQHVSKLGTMVHVKTNPEYTAPEILSDEPAFPQSDIWSVGVLTYILLSGVSPFKGATKEETKQNITFVRYRFEHLYKELTQEATRFIMLLFKRAPTKRPTVEECHETRWLLPTEFMIKKRERAVFLGNRLKEVSDAYHSEKAQEVTKCDSLVTALGGRAPITRSNSIQEELLTTV